ncbi:MAG TPA: hypothetical protein VFN95_16420 [Flavitalea sp.]|nr:hypothetical protein [Flavitalea sp.]
MSPDVILYNRQNLMVNKGYQQARDFPKGCVYRRPFPEYSKLLILTNYRSPAESLTVLSGSWTQWGGNVLYLESTVWIAQSKQGEKTSFSRRLIHDYYLLEREIAGKTL